MRLLAIPIGHERQIRGHQRARAGEHKDQQQDCEHNTGDAADQSKCRSEQYISDRCGACGNFACDLISARQRPANCRITSRQRFDPGLKTLREFGCAPQQFLHLAGQRRNRKHDDRGSHSDERKHQQYHTGEAGDPMFVQPDHHWVQDHCDKEDQRKKQNHRLQSAQN